MADPQWQSQAPPAYSPSRAAREPRRGGWIALPLASLVAGLACLTFGSLGLVDLAFQTASWTLLPVLVCGVVAIGLGITALALRTRPRWPAISGIILPFIVIVLVFGMYIFALIRLGTWMFTGH